MIDADYQILLADFKRRGRSVLICPPACATAIQGYIPKPEHRSALSDHARLLDERRLRKLPLRTDLRDEIHPSDKTDKMVRERYADMGRKGQIVAKERKEKETEESPRTMRLDGLPTMRRTTQTIAYPVRDRSPLQIVQFAKREVMMREDKGVIYIQLLDKHRQPTGKSYQLK